MSVTEHERHELYTWFQENMGSERADILINLLPPVGWGDVATRRDLAEFQAATARDLSDLRAETKRDIAELRAETKHEFAELRAELAEMETRIGTRLTDQMRTFGTWLFASQAAVIAALSMLFALT
jgi:ribosomal protein L29